MIDAPMVFALTAGMVAAFNPCGFAMLPAYLGYFLGTGADGGQTARGTSANVLHALGVGAVVTGGFVAIFGLAGVLITQFSLRVQRFAPWLTIVIGLALVPLGIAMLRGWEPKISIPRLQRGGGGRGLGSMFVFGVSYATVSLTCTLPPFLAAVSTTFDRGSFTSGIAVFGAYAAGMGLVLMTLTVALGLARHSLVGRMKQVLPYVNRVAGGLVLAAGAYVAYYGYFDVQTLRGGAVNTGPVNAVGNISSTISNWIETIGPGVVAGILGGLVGAVILLALVLRRRPGDGEEDAEQQRERELQTS